LTNVIPDLDCEKTDKQAEDHPQRGSNPGDTALNARAVSPTASLSTAHEIAAAMR
jgi:hypothetical protein